MKKILTNANSIMRKLAKNLSRQSNRDPFALPGRRSCWFEALRLYKATMAGHVHCRQCCSVVGRSSVARVSKGIRVGAFKVINGSVILRDALRALPTSPRLRRPGSTNRGTIEVYRNSAHPEVRVQRASKDTNGSCQSAPRGKILIELALTIGLLCILLTHAPYVTCDNTDTFTDYYNDARQLDTQSTTTPDTWPSALALYLKAHNADPCRVEPFIRIAQHYYATGDHNLTYFFAYNACQMPVPQEATDLELYTRTRYDILGICAWYTQHYDTGQCALEQALRYHPDDEHLKQNLKYYIEYKRSEHPKIVGLIPARNESKILEQCLHALSLFTDAIVYLDDASDDNSVAIVESVANTYHIEKIITKDVWQRDEPGDRNALLNAGREIGGTHFIVIDADELLTANCLQDNFLRHRILQLHPGDRLLLNWIHLWGSPDLYRCDESWRNRFKDFIFCDDGLCSYNSDFIHTSRTPQNLSGTSYYVESNDYGMLHFQFIHWANVLTKQSWYKCLERIRMPEKSIDAINQRYVFSMDTTHVETAPTQPLWFNGYDFYTPELFDTQEQWRTEQIKQWIAQYGADYFKGLDFWGLDIEHV